MWKGTSGKATEQVIVEQTDEHHLYYSIGETRKPVDRSSNRKKIVKRFLLVPSQLKN